MTDQILDMWPRDDSEASTLVKIPTEPIDDVGFDQSYIEVGSQELYQDNRSIEADIKSEKLP